MPDRACVQLSATVAIAAAVSMFAFAGTIGSTPVAATRVVSIPAFVLAILPAVAMVRTSSLTGRHIPVFGRICRRSTSVLILPCHPAVMLMAEAEPGEHRAPEEAHPHP